MALQNFYNTAFSGYDAAPVLEVWDDGKALVFSVYISTPDPASLPATFTLGWGGFDMDSCISHIHGELTAEKPVFILSVPVFLQPYNNMFLKATGSADLGCWVSYDDMAEA
ncbi:hypothetical protein LZ24_02539 [Desulfobotulus alkaliphilus]|uniref:Uncharacterized protein n=1 Tax=Desulfobotulus alkaliphilus TaxID=622671 RepID=A0A562RJK3_9BACT|nr:hypothetical protein [Desulfobotulus alkaliphilus]TWI68566.1 hypothetical protein LZ24_02539 [Desulfobotulus alkaliphilus]